MPIRLPIRIAAIALLARALAAPVAAQEVLGRTLDAATGEPLTAVDVTLHRGADVVARSVSDGGGFFRWSEIPEGRYRVTASLLGYRETEARDVAIEGRRVELVVRLSVDPVALDSLVVVGRMRPRLSVDPVESFRMREMTYGRAGLGAGHFFDREAIAEIDPGLVGDVAKRAPGVRMAKDHTLRLLPRARCDGPPAVFVNGQRRDLTEPELRFLEGVEVYRDLIPVEYTHFGRGTCGVVAYTTGHGDLALTDAGGERRIRAEVVVGGYLPMRALDAGTATDAGMNGGPSAGFAIRYAFGRWLDSDVRLATMMVFGYGLRATDGVASTTVGGDLTLARVDLSVRPWTVAGRPLRLVVGGGVRKYDAEKAIIPELCTFDACLAAQALAVDETGPVAYAGIELALILGRLYLSLGDNVSNLHGATQHDLTMSASLAMRR